MKKISLLSVYSQTFKIIRKQPIVVMLFVVFAAAEAFLLTIFFLAPRVPFIKVLGPLVRAFWGEQFLHYPANFLLLPRIDSLIRACLSVVLSSFLTGLAVLIVEDVYSNKTVKVRHLVKVAGKNYFLLFAIVLAVSVFFYAALRLSGAFLIKAFAGRLWLGTFLTAYDIILAVLLQAVFIYTIPALLIGKEPFFRSFGVSISTFGRNFLLTFGLVALPSVFYVPLIVLQGNAAFLITKFDPEIILALAYLGIAVSSLVIDLLVTVASTYTYLRVRQP